MKRFVVHILLFFLLSSLCAWAVGAVLLRQFNNTDNRYNIESHDILIVGSSRARCHINPLLLDSLLGCDSYNLGLNNCNVDYHSSRIQHYLRLVPHPPRTIIWSIDFLTMRQSAGYAAAHSYPFLYYDPDFAKELITYPEFNDPLYHLTSNIFVQRVMHPYLYHNHRWFAKGIFEEQVSGVKGFDELHGSWDGVAFAAIDSIHVERDPQTMRVLLCELERLRRDSIRVVFVFTPLYHAASDKIVHPEKLYAMYDSIARQFNIPILDYTHCHLSYDTTYFCNAQHLNNLGANLFTQMLANDIQTL